MKILDLCEFYSERGGGVRSYLNALGRAAARHGHELIVVAPGPRDEDATHEGMRLIRYAAPSMPYDPSYSIPWGIECMRDVARREQPEILQTSSPFVPALVAGTVRRAPVRAYVHHSDPIGCYLSYPNTRLLPECLTRPLSVAAWSYLRGVATMCDVTVVAGDWLEQELTQRGLPRVKTVRFGIEHARFGAHRRDAALRAELLGPLAVDLDARLVLIAGRLAIDKRQRELVRAVRVSAERRPLALVVLGDGPERARVLREAHGLRVTHVPFTRDRDEYARLLASADVLLHGSRSETYGFVLVEALASGTPIVVPQAGGAGALAGAEFAETYPPRANAAQIAAGLDRALDRLGPDTHSAAQAAAASHPSFDDHFVALFELYRDLYAKSSRRW
jgi:alpha-1,6-mannosyltransferase